MKRTKVVGVSVLIMLAMVFSTFSITALKELGSENNNEDHGELEVVKEVFDDGQWTEGPIEANIGDTLQFRINITYHNTSGIPKTRYAHQIRVNDTFPPCLNYISGTADPEEDIWSEDPEYLFWDFGNKKLNDTESLVIKYNATVVNITDEEGQENNVTVKWDEHCTGGENLVSEDVLIIIVRAEPQINVQKEVWDPVKHEYVKNITTYPGEILRFKINVSNLGFDNLTGVILNDTLPPFLNFDSAWGTPIVNDRNITWYLGNIPGQNWIIVILNATVENVEGITVGKNIANVTSDEGLNDSDNVTITVKKPFIIEKKVKHPDTGEWVDEIPYVKGCEPVRFRINATYYGDPNVTMKCLIIYDQLPIECLEYADNVYIEIAGDEITPDNEFYPDIFTENDTFILCNNLVEVPEGGIFFSWIDPLLGLNNGKSVVIEFDASVIEYCECEGEDCCKYENCAYGRIWGCCCELYYEAYDCVIINCTALPGEFNKTVSKEEPTNWGKEVHTVQGMTIKFKLELIYYGNESLTNVTVLDILPCCLEYKDTIQSPPGTVIEVSPDKKMIWWNISQNVSDCETVTIIFRATVTGSSECGGCINYADVYGYIWRFCEYYELVIDRTDNATIYAEANSPPCAPDLSGPTEGIVGVSMSYDAWLEDVDDDQMHYWFDWGDGSNTGWLGPVGPSKVKVTESHTWAASGTYTVKAKAKDEHDAEGDWTNVPLIVNIKTVKIDLSLSTFNFGKVEATVTNSGTADVNNIKWEFNISRDAILDFRDINIDGNGTIPTLLAGGSQTISSDSVGFTRIGLADITVTVSKPGVIEPTSVTARAFFLGPIVITF